MIFIPDSRYRKAPFPLDTQNLDAKFPASSANVEDLDGTRSASTNISFQYMYRDAANYKQHGKVIFTNHTHLSIEDVEKRIHSHLHEGEYFIARQVQVQERFFPNVGEDDHPWHEFVKVEETSEAESDPINRDITFFIRDLEKAKTTGWDSMNVREDLAQFFEREMQELRQALEAGRNILK